MAQAEESSVGKHSKVVPPFRPTRLERQDRSRCVQVCCGWMWLLCALA